MARRSALAHAVGTGQTNLPVKFHGVDLQALRAAARRAKWPVFTPPEAKLSRRYRGRLLHRRSHQTLLPWEIQQDRRSLSAWIDAQAQMKPLSALDSLPTSRQVAFVEKLARIKRRAVPDECFRDKGLMSKWIDGNR
jgi:hypothetical protein